jgi:hypothetical protein
VRGGVALCVSCRACAWLLVRVAVLVIKMVAPIVTTLRYALCAALLGRLVPLVIKVKDLSHPVAMALPGWSRVPPSRHDYACAKEPLFGGYRLTEHKDQQRSSHGSTAGSSLFVFPLLKPNTPPEACITELLDHAGKQKMQTSSYLGYSCPRSERQVSEQKAR